MKDDTYDACAWGSHLPALLACLADTVGPVLEIGIGHFSTPALHAFCVQADRRLVSVENNPEWMNKFNHMEGPCHHFEPDCKVVSGMKGWAVTFIDDSPGGEHRARHFRDFIQLSIFLVVHDYHLENSDSIGPLLKGVRHHVTKTYQPPTLIASKVREIPRSILCL